MIKTFCDMCGKEIINPAEQVWIEIRFHIDTKIDIDTRLPFMNTLCICSDCLKVIAKLIVKGKTQ